MATEEKEEDHSKKATNTISDHYPLDSSGYKILEEIGKGVSAIVYKAICISMDSSLVAIKTIDLEKSKADFDNVRREAKTMTLLCHPNILKAHCSFTVDSCLWVVMPFMSGGSFQSIIASSFPDGLPEPCIAAVLKEILSALSYLHGQGHLHRDIKAGNILIDSNGSVRLADFGVSASIYENNLSSSSAGSSSSRLLTDVTGTPYWMAPEVIHSHTGYSFKADMWSFGITALELAHGRPPLSHLPPSKSLMMKITQRFRFSDHYDKTKDNMNKKFSKAFKDMVGLCLDHDPSKRRTAEKLLKHSFFKNCKGPDFLVKNVLQGLPPVEQRLKDEKIRRFPSFDGGGEEEDDDASNVRQRRISGWNFNEEGLELEPVFPSDPKEADGDLTVGKRVTFGGETLIQEKTNKGFDEKGGTSSGGADNQNEASGGGAGGGMERVLRTMLVLRDSLDDQRQRVGHIIALAGGEETVPNREEQLIQYIDTLRNEVESERKRRLDLEKELELLKLQRLNE